MIRIRDISHQNTALFLEQAIAIAEYYGFSHVDEAPTQEEPVVSGRIPHLDTSKLNLVRRDERSLVPLVRACAKKGLGDRRMPVFLWREGPMMREGGVQYMTLELHVLGVPSAISEALLLSIADAIATEAGVDRRVVCINSIGAPESSMRYLRDLTAYLRKHLGNLSAAQRSRVVDDPVGALMQLQGRGDPVADNAPASMEYLNEEERRHFWNVLEYLEATNLYYELNPRVLGSSSCWSHTLFDMCRIDAENETLVPFARGGRYDALASQCVGAGASAVSISIMCEVHGRSKPKTRKRKQKVDLYFAHLGPEAKRRSIGVLESLRRARIPVYQSFAHDHIAEQMQTAKQLAVPYVLVMGHKEATEGTVLVRETKSNSQEPVPVEYLPGYLKRRHVAALA